MNKILQVEMYVIRTIQNGNGNFVYVKDCSTYTRGDVLYIASGDTVYFEVKVAAVEPIEFTKDKAKLWFEILPDREECELSTAPQPVPGAEASTVQWGTWASRMFRRPGNLTTQEAALVHEKIYSIEKVIWDTYANEIVEMSGKGARISSDVIGADRKTAERLKLVRLLFRILPEGQRQQVLRHVFAWQLIGSATQRDS